VPASLSLALALGGCAGPAVIGTVSTGGPAPASTDAVPVDAALAQSLETAANGARVYYRLADGSEGVLIIGQLYPSGRGLPCRLGRVNSPEPGPTVPSSYPFCRIGNQWFAMRPVVISGY
jgi:hypothetical protein